MRLGLVLVICSLLFGCDKIDERLNSERSIFTGCNCEVSSDDPFVTDRIVLIEEFTGHTCVYCPGAAEIIKELENKHPGLISTIAIHCGNYGTPDPNGGFPADYRTSAGNEIYNFADPIGQPSGLISRMDYNTNNFVKLDGEWDGAVTDVLQTSTAEIGLFAESVVHNDTLCLKAKFKALSDLTGRTLRWCAFLTESSIISPQKNLSTTIEDYEHNHVLRAALNGAFGTTIKDFSGIKDEIACDTRSLILDKKWNRNNCEIVVYIYEEGPDTREVLQAITIDL